jgi:hypothetical protein
MIPKQYILRMILTKRPVHQTWETEPKTLRELRDYLEKLNENPNPMTPNGAEGIRKTRQHHGYDWGQRVTPKKLIEYTKHMFAVDETGAGCTVQVIENKLNGELTAFYNNIGEFEYVVIESDNLNTYISKRFVYSPFEDNPEFGWEAAKADEEGHLIDPDGVYGAWFKKMREHIIHVFNGAEVDCGVVVSSLSLWDENDERMVFKCSLREIR